MKINQIGISACAFILMTFSGCTHKKYVSLISYDTIIVENSNTPPDLIGVHETTSTFAKDISSAINAATPEPAKFLTVYKVQFQSSETNISFYVNQDHFIHNWRSYRSPIDLEELITNHGINKPVDSNQWFDPIVKTSGDEVEAQGTQGHP